MLEFETVIKPLDNLRTEENNFESNRRVDSLKKNFWRKLENFKLNRAPVYTIK